MSASVKAEVDELDPTDAFAALQDNPDAAMVDVRTHAEWAFTGGPDLSAIGKELWRVEWVSYPTMSPNPQFLTELETSARGTLPGHLLFLCRSGARSMAAAQAVVAVCQDRGLAVRCTNVREGFEGDLNGDRHRGTQNGWKARGLPWLQS